MCIVQKAVGQSESADLTWEDLSPGPPIREGRTGRFYKNTKKKVLKSKLKGSFTYEAKDAYFKAWKKTKIVATHMGKSEATHFSVVELHGCFLVLKVLAFYGCRKYLLASMS